MICKGHGIEQNLSTGNLESHSKIQSWVSQQPSLSIGLNHPATGNLCTMWLIGEFPSMYGSAKRIEILMEA